MGKQPGNALQTLGRWGSEAIDGLGRPSVAYDILVGIAGRFAPPGKTRRRLARRFDCKAAMVPHMILYRTAIYALTGLIILLCLRALIIICAD